MVKIVDRSEDVKRERDLINRVEELQKLARDFFRPKGLGLFTGRIINKQFAVHKRDEKIKGDILDCIVVSPEKTTIRVLGPLYLEDGVRLAEEYEKRPYGEWTVEKEYISP